MVVRNCHLTSIANLLSAPLVSCLVNFSLPLSVMSSTSEVWFMTFWLSLMLASCKSPGRIADGMKIGSDYGHGRTVRYQCNAEYTLDGREELVCNDGAWSFDPPTCKGM